MRCPFSEPSGNDLFADGVEDDIGHAVQFELLHDVGPVSCHGEVAHVQHGRHLFVGFAFGQELQNFLFALCQEIIGVLEAALLQLAHVIFA